MANEMPTLGVKDILVEEGIGLWAVDTSSVDVWAISISRQIDTPHTLITLYDAPGLAPEPGLDIDYPSVQVVVRGTVNGYMAAWKKARQIRDALLGRSTEVRNGDMWASVTMMNDIMHLGEDENERPMLTMTFNLIIHPGDMTNSHRNDVEDAIVFVWVNVNG